MKIIQIKCRHELQNLRKCSLLKQIAEKFSIIVNINQQGKTMSEAQDFEKASLAFSEAQGQLNELIEARSRLETQYQENKIVLEEFDSLNEDSKIYKLTGPILMPQDYSEAKMNVNKRIEFIQEEIKRAESKVGDQEKKIEGARATLLALRSKLSQ